MWNLINAPETEIFGIAIALMVLLGVLEVISMLAGGISDWLDNLLPDSLTETAHAEVGLDAADAGVFVRFLSWLYVGRVPVLMLMVVFLAVYGLTGYLFQTTFAAVFGSYLNGWLAAVAVWFLSLPLVRLTAGGAGEGVSMRERKPSLFVTKTYFPCAATPSGACVGMDLSRR